MKRFLSTVIVLILLFSLFSIAQATGNGNIDGGGGGMGSGSGSSFWMPGDNGVRVTVVRATDRAPVTAPIDFSNQTPTIAVHFGKVSKISYANGSSLALQTTTYSVYVPVTPMPIIISSADLGPASIEQIKQYFCSEYMAMTIGELTGMNYNVLLSGDYKLLLEPIAFITFQGIRMAMTATEAALYDQQLGGGLRAKMVSLSHKNLPLAMFLETPDLGFPAWSGSRTTAAANADIISSLGIGVVRYSGAEPEAPPEVTTFDYEYRVNTEVITSVRVSGGQSDPDNPVSVTFNIGGIIYNVGTVYYPSGDSQLAWVRWTTPSTPQTVTIHVSVSGGSANQSTIRAKIVDLSGNDPPNPTADDRNYSFTAASVPINAEKTSASWGIWRPWWQSYWVWHSLPTEDDEDAGYWCDHGWWEFSYDSYSASLSASMSITPDGNNPTAYGTTMKSGYGINQTVTTSISTNQPSAVTSAQNAVTYFPEFRYETYRRLLERTSSGYGARFQFRNNKYSTYNSRTHFTPIWYPDGTYKPYTWLIDCWTPAGMLSKNLTDTVTISGNLWMDWHIAPKGV